MSRVHLSRRAALKGLGGILIGLPALEIMTNGRAGAEGLTAPKRLVVFYSPNGTNCGGSGDITRQVDFRPPELGPNFVLGAEVAPLEPLRDRLLMVSGITGESMQADVPKLGDLHSIGLAQMLSGVGTVTDNTTYGIVPGANSSVWGQGITLDQYLAKKIGAATRFPSLEFGVQNTTDYGVLPFSRMIYAGPNQPIPAEQDPAAMFKRIFSDGSSTATATVDQTLLQRKSVLDFVRDDFLRLQPRLGANDRHKLDAHLNGIRELESRIQNQIDTGTTTSASCTSLTPVANQGDPLAKANFPTTGKLHMDVLALALKCDMTRIASLQWSWARSDLVHTWVGAAKGHHTMTHECNGGCTELAAINTFYATQLAYLGQALADITDVDGKSVLDNTVIYWGSDVNWAYSHTFDNLRAFFLGSCGGAMITGQRVDVGGVPHQKLLVTLMNAMGVMDNQFGDPAYGSGPLPGILV